MRPYRYTVRFHWNLEDGTAWVEWRADKLIELLRRIRLTWRHNRELFR